MLVCLARPELADLRPSFGSGAAGAVTVELGPMLPADVRNLVLDMVEPGSPAGTVDEIVSVSAGNPLFAMQLVAWAGVAGETARSMPPAVRTLLAHRIARLGPGELAVVQCAAIVGRDCTLAALAALLPASAQSTVERHLAALARSQIVEPSAHGYRFRHHLIHRSAYLAMDPSFRARLHEQYADWLIAEGRDADPATADEIIGYHLEQAHDNAQTLGTRNVQARLLGVRAATHLGLAGRRASRHFDPRAAASLLTRALRLAPRDHPGRPRLLLDSAQPLRASGRLSEASATLLEAIERATDIGDVRTEWRARLELAWVRACFRGNGPVQEEMLSVAEKAVDALDPVRDHEELAIAWFMIGSVRESFGELTRAEFAYRRAMEHAQRNPGNFNHGGITWGLASVLLEGPTAVLQAISRCRKLLEFGGPGENGVMFELSALLAMNGDFGEARAILVHAASELHARGSHRPLLFLAHAQARVELYAGEPRVAEGHARHGMERGAKLGGDEADTANAVLLAQSLCRQRRFDEAEEVLAEHANATPVNEIGRTAMLNAVRAEVRTHRGASVDAIALANRAVASVDRTDLFNLRAELRITLATALRGAGDAAGARRTADEALRLFAAKGNAVGLTRIRELFGDDAPIADAVEIGGGPEARVGRRPPEDGRRLTHPQAP